MATTGNSEEFDLDWASQSAKAWFVPAASCCDGDWDGNWDGHCSGSMASHQILNLTLGDI
jgi:hypothetical protein